MMTADSLLTALRRAARAVASFVRWAARGLVWFLAPVVTSLHGAMDKTDFRPLIARVLLTWAGAKSTLRELITDPKFSEDAAAFLLAVAAGVFTVFERMFSHPTPTPDPNSAPPAPPTITNTVNVSVGAPDATPAVPRPPSPQDGALQ